MKMTFVLLNRTGIRRYVDGMHITGDAMGVLERHTGEVLTAAREMTVQARKKRIDGIIMRRAVRR